MSLAFSMRSSKGAYALLLGSGLSRAAGIPTGWEVVLDLTRRLAEAKGEDPTLAPDDWYREQYGTEPDYSELLEGLAPSPADRQALLRQYFEPTEEEREQNLKIPTPAHHAIAELIERGFVRVVVTTNFDRLLETALEARGLSPTVIASPDQAEGALPLAHSPITIIKAHGDYLDTRIKNTPKELAEYDPKINRLLDQVFDEYGLVTCGWSAAWDAALRTAIERCSSRRFTTYFASQGEPHRLARQLIQRRQGVLIPIEDANRFFDRLKESLVSLEEASRPHPESKAAAVASLKRYLAEKRHRIRAHDLLMSEVDRALDAAKASEFSADRRWNQDEFRDRVKRYEGLTDTLETFFAVGCYWATPSQAQLWQKALSHVLPTQLIGGQTVYIALRDYPAIRLLYAGGIAASAHQQHEVLASLLLLRLFNPEIHADEAVATRLNPIRVMSTEVGQKLAGMERRYTPLSDHLFETLRSPFKEVAMDAKTYEDAFDKFEYMQGLVSSHLSAQNGWGSVGRFGWKWRHAFGETTLMDRVKDEAEEQGSEWGPLRVGLFSGDLDTFLEIERQYRRFLSELPWH